MTSPLDGVRRNSFRQITESTYHDVTLGRILNVSRTRLHNADHIVTEFQNGTLILSEEETVEHIVTLLKLFPSEQVRRQLLHTPVNGPPMKYGDDYKLGDFYPMPGTYRDSGGHVRPLSDKPLPDDGDDWELRHIQ